MIVITATEDRDGLRMLLKEASQLAMKLVESDRYHEDLEVKLTKAAVDIIAIRASLK